MAQFQNIVLTQKGRALMAKMLAGTTGVDFRRIQTSSDVYTPEQLPSLSGFSVVNQSTLISQITRVNDTTIKIEGGINNTLLAQSYFCQSVGVTAIDPDEGEVLFGVTIVDLSVPENTPDFIPAFNGLTSTGLLFDLILTVDNADCITLQVDPAAVVTIHQFLRHIKSEKAHEKRFAALQRQIDELYKLLTGYEPPVNDSGVLVTATGDENNAWVQLPNGDVEPLVLKIT